MADVKILGTAWQMGREKPGQELTEEGFAPADGLEDI